MARAIFVGLRRTGDSVGTVDTGTSLNRYRFNQPAGTVQDNNSVVSLGGEYDGSLATFGFPANTLSAQLFCQARNDGTATIYAGVMGWCDTNRNPYEMIAVGGAAYGAGAYGLYFGGGTSADPIECLAYIDGYSSNHGLWVNQRYSGSPVATFQYSGSSVLEIQHDRVNINEDVYFGTGGMMMNLSQNQVKASRFTTLDNSNAEFAGMGYGRLKYYASCSYSLGSAHNFYSYMTDDNVATVSVDTTTNGHTVNNLIIFKVDGTEKFSINPEGIVNYAGSMGDSTKDPRTDAPDDWVEIKINGTTYYIPAYSA
ncbi:MAG: hypothetical protein DRP12_00045 [Candidatus Aenigmatarchaeota archaeon]|nr:MAG: hypothetical protein DRP12_00045 [Candidatus Aenigmarchaeota archaeon]